MKNIIKKKQNFLRIFNLLKNRKTISHNEKRITHSILSKGKVLLIIIILFISILIISVEIPFATAASYVYSEDFTTTVDMDSSNTNVTGWGSGTIELPRKRPIYGGKFGTRGWVMDVFVSGDYAYLSDFNYGLWIANISDPKHPKYIGSWEILGNYYGIFISGDIAYLITYSKGLRIFNVSNPFNPTLITTFNYGGYSLDVFVSGDYAYVADGYDGLRVIDIKDPTNPTIVGTYNTPGRAMEVFVSGDYAYIADYGLVNGLRIVDISNPTAPFSAGVYNTPHNAQGVFVSGDYAYIADGGSGLQIIDISDPTAPSLAGTYDTPDNAMGVFVSGDYAYVADYGTGLLVFNISDPIIPTFAGSYNTGGWAQKVVVFGEYAYIADDYNGMMIIQISDPVDPTFVSSCDTPNYAFGVCVSGDYAYVADDYSGLQVIDIIDPTNPVLAGFCDIGGYARAVSISGDYAYVCDWSSGLKVVDITDPTSPVLAGSCVTPNSPASIFISGDYAYVAGWSSGLQVVDITDPTSPTLAGSCDTPDLSYDIFISGDYAYVADYGSGLQIINITDPTNPNLTSSYDTPGYAKGIFVSGDYAYISDDYRGLQVIDITDPTKPILFGTKDVSGSAYGIYVSGDRAYVANYIGFIVFDITNPANPIIEGSLDTAGNSIDVFISGDYAYVADYDSGLQIIEVMRNKCRQFEFLAIAQSLAIFSGSSDISLVNATIVSNAYSPLDTSITYFLSPDNGLNWELVTPGLKHYFTNDGYQLKWKAVLQTSNVLITSKIFNLTITFNTGLNPPSLLFPLNGSSINDNTPTFEWESVLGATKYFIQLDVSNNFNSPNLINAKVISTSYTPLSPLSEGIWYWRVGANDSEGNLGLFSTTRSVEIDITLPNPPFLTSPSNNSIINDNTPTFSWSSIFDADYYILQLDISDSFSDPITFSNIVSPTYTITSALSDDIWYWRVCAVDSASNQGSYSSPYTLTIDTSLPNPPNLISPPDISETNDDTPTFSWSSVLDADYYILQVDNNPNFNSIYLITISDIYSTFYTLTTSLFDDVWYWRVCTVDQAGNQGPYPDFYLFWVDTTPPGTPSLISPDNNTTVNDNRPTFTWSSVLDIDYYIFQLDTSLNFNSPDFINVVVGSTSYSHFSTLSDGTLYWRVCAVDYAGNQGSFPSPFTLNIDTLPPGTPTLISPDNIITVNDNRPTFIWSSVSDINYYIFQLDTSLNFDSPNLINITVASTSYIPVSTLSDGTWYWRVCAVDYAGNQGSYPSPFTLNIDTTPPIIDTPEDITYEEDSTGHIISWNPSDINPYSYIIIRNSTVIEDALWDGSSIIVNVDGLPSGTYIFNCTVYDEAGNSVSDIVLIIVTEKEDIGTPTEEFPLTITIIASLTIAGGIGIAGVSIILLRKRRRANEVT